jgi:ankyrin repeat protein/Ca2+-binding EF-hand superfamily protein
MTTTWNSSRAAPDSSAFLKACHMGSLDAVKLFIKQRDLKSCQKATDETKKTGLHLAAKNGNSEVAAFLVANGWEVDARDRLNTTPLQHACLAGHLETVNLLLTKAADPTLQDNVGRSAIHYACCCTDTEVIRFLLAKNRNLISLTDNSGCSALHYAVFNSGAKQVDMIRILLEFGAQVDAIDNVGKTPLHHAAETGKKRCIPILMKHGANVYARETVNKKTPLDMAMNPTIEQLIVMYGPEQLKSEYDSRKPPQLETQNASPVNIGKLKEMLTSRVKKAPDNETTPLWASKVNNARNRSVSSAKYTSGGARDDWRNKLVEILREVQAQGIIAQQHAKKPYLYSGSWIEGIQDAVELTHALNSCTPTEAALRVFNMLEPYPGKIPEGRRYEPMLDNYFGEYRSINPDHLSSVKLSGTEQDNREIRQLLGEKDQALGFIKRENETLKEELQQSRQKYIDMIQQMPKKEDLLLAISEKENAIKAKENLEFQLKEANFKLSQTQSQLDYYKSQLEKLPKIDEFEALRRKYENSSKTDEILRAKAGQLFLSALDRKNEKDAESPSFDLQDDIVLARFASVLENNPPSLAQRLQDVDANKDGKVTKSEMNKVLIGLGVSPQDMIVLFKLAGFRAETYSIKIRDFCRMVSNRQILRNKLEKELFVRIKEKFEKVGMTNEQIFEFLDSSKDGKVNFQELSNAMDSLQMMVSRADKYSIFSVLDSDRNGVILLEELSSRLQEVENMPDQDISQDEEPIEIQEGEAEIVQPTVIQRKRIDSIPKEDTLNFLGISKETPFNPQEVRKKVMNVLSEDKYKISQSASKNLEASKPVIKRDKVVNGNIAVQIVRGRGLGEGNHAVQVMLEGAENNLKTDLKSGDSPEWKFRGRFKLLNKKLGALAENLQFRVMGSRGLEALVDIPWMSTVEFPNTWEVNSEFELKEPGGRKKGFLVIQIKWIPKEELRIEGGGSLMINAVSGFDGFIMEFNIEDNVCQLKQDEISTISHIRLAKTKPIPPMKCAYLELESRKVLYMCSISWEVALTSSTWTPPLTVNLAQSKSISIRLKWIPFTADFESQEKAATKLQAFARGYQTRVMKPILEQGNKLVYRRGISYDDRYYLISVLQSDEGFVANLHVADDPETPMYDIIHSLSIQDSSLEEIQKGIKVIAGPKLALKGNEEIVTANGDLVIECVDLRGNKCFFGMSCCGVYEFSTAGPPFDRKVVLVNIYAMGFELPQIEVTAFNIEDRSTIDTTKLSWSSAFASPQSWVDAKAVFSFGALTARLMWNPYTSQKTQEDTAALKIQKAWKHKSELPIPSLSRLIARRGIQRNGRYFLVSILDDDPNFEIQIHVADDPATPMWNIADSLRISKETEIDFIFNHVQISSDLHAALPHSS